MLPSGQTVGQILNEESLNALEGSDVGEDEGNNSEVITDDSSTSEVEEPSDDYESPEVSVRVDALCPQIFARETTMDAFKRLTKYQRQQKQTKQGFFNPALLPRAKIGNKQK